MEGWVGEKMSVLTRVPLLRSEKFHEIARTAKPTSNVVEPLTAELEFLPVRGTHDVREDLAGGRRRGLVT